MKTLLGAFLTVAILGGSQMAWANNCQSIALDLYKAQGYQQRCAYQLKQTPNLVNQFKQAGCDKSLSGADKNQVLNKVNSELGKAFQNSKKDSCEAGKKLYN